MTLMKWPHEAAANRSINNINYLFNDLFDGMITNDFKRWNAPSVNISESETDFRLDVAAPGFKREDFKINVQENTLSISSSLKEEKTENSPKYSRREFNFGSFNRSFTLPKGVNAEQIKASYENGILSLSIPKMEEAKPKTHEITIG